MLAGYGQRAQAARFHVRLCRKQIEKHHLNAPRSDVGDRLARALVRNMREVQTGGKFEQLR